MQANDVTSNEKYFIRTKSRGANEFSLRTAYDDVIPGMRQYLISKYASLFYILFLDDSFKFLTATSEIYLSAYNRSLYEIYKMNFLERYCNRIVTKVDGVNDNNDYNDNERQSASKYEDDDESGNGQT